MTNEEMIEKLQEIRYDVNAVLTEGIDRSRPQDADAVRYRVETLASSLVQLVDLLLAPSDD